MDSITLTDKFGHQYLFHYHTAIGSPPADRLLRFYSNSTVLASSFIARFSNDQLMLLQHYLKRFEVNITQTGYLQPIYRSMESNKLRVYPFPKVDKLLDKKIAKVRSRLQMLLNQTLIAERAEALRIKQEFEPKNPLQKVAARAGAMRDGVENIVDSLVGFWIDLLGITGSKSANMLLVGYLLQKGTKKNKDDAADFVEKHFATGDSYQQLVKALGFDPTKIDKEQVKKAISQAKTIMDDEKSMVIIGQFLKEYVAAQHELELYEKVSEAVFGFILSALFAYFAGSALVAMAGKTLAQSKALRAIGVELSKLAELLEKRPKRKGKGGRRIKTKREERDDLLEEEYSKLEPLTGDARHKTVHRQGTMDDAFTELDDGKPLGAVEGEIPINTRGLDELPENHEALKAQGWPDLNYEFQKGRFAKDYKNFADAKPVELPEGTKIYRIIDEKSQSNGAYWAYELPKGKAEWRSNYAVKDSWNDNGYYVEHTVGKDGLKVWEGTTAAQKYEDSNFVLNGGEKQLFITPGQIETSKPALTGWTQ